jgi:hypothetical protein
MRLLGNNEAENRSVVHVASCGVSLYMFDGFNPEASLWLVRTCAKWKQPGLVHKVDQLLAQQADPNVGLKDPSFNGYTPLIFLAMSHPRLSETLAFAQVSTAIDRLIAAKADPHRENEAMPFGQWVPLRFAAQNQSRPGVESLLRYVDIGERFAWAAGENVQHVMLEEFHNICSPATCKLIEANDRYDNCATVLLQRFSSKIVAGNLTAAGAEKLCSGCNDEHDFLDPGARADPDGAGVGGVTALMNVIMKGDVDTTHALLRARANPCQTDSSGATPLHLAAAFVYPEIVKLLLDARASPGQMDHAGFTPWMIIGELCPVVGTEEKTHIQELVQEMAPRTLALDIVETLEKNWEGVFNFCDARTPESLETSLRLQESLFFNHRMVRRGAYETRAPRELLQKVGNLIISMLKTDPLTGDKKILVKYLLQATKGPSTEPVGHIKVPWESVDNRSSYREALMKAAKGMLQNFADECNRFRDDINTLAEDDPQGPCAELLALEGDKVIVPEEWQRKDPYWKKVQERQILRYDPEWALGVHDGPTACLALLRLGEIRNLADYSKLVQVYHTSMETLLAQGYIKYSNLCNVAFQDKLKAVVERVADKHSLDIQVPEKVVAAKRLGRLMEKTREAREERGLMSWPGLASDYLGYSHCFHILDTVRIAFTCSGFYELLCSDDEEETEEEEDNPDSDSSRPAPTPVSRGITDGHAVWSSSGDTPSVEASPSAIDASTYAKSPPRSATMTGFLDRGQFTHGKSAANLGRSATVFGQSTTPSCKAEAGRSASKTKRKQSRRETLANAPVASEEDILSYIVNHRPPERDGYDFCHVEVNDGTTGYLGPDRQGSPLANAGDQTFYFVLDLLKPHHVDRLEVINAFGNPKHYMVREYEIGISNDIGAFKLKEGRFPHISPTELQNVKVSGYGRYIKFVCKTYGNHSAGLGFIRIIKEATMEKEAATKRKFLGEQVESCMTLLQELRGLTMEKDGLCVLRQKSGFASGVSGSGGYADVKLLVMADVGEHIAFDGTKIPLRIVGEAQLILHDYMEVKHRMHLVYEVDRGSFDRR